MNANQPWIDRQTANNESRRSYEKERLAIWALEMISEAINRAGLSKADIARSLGTSRAHVTQVLSGSRNVTLSTLADLAWAAGVRVDVRAEPLRYGDFIASPVRVVEFRRPCVKVKSGELAAASQGYPDVMIGCG